MEDPIQRHPTRPEQLDILTTLIAGVAAQQGSDRPLQVLDLGAGTGYLAHGLMRKHGNLRVTGVDMSAESLAQASENLANLPGEFRAVIGDLRSPQSIELGTGRFDVVCTCLTFHDLTDVQKQSVFAWVAGLLAPGGHFFVYDRLRLTEASLFPLQQLVWQRIEDVTGRGMRSAPSYEAYLADLGDDNGPAALEDYFAWYRANGFSPACLHLHGNIALLAGALDGAVGAG